MSGNSERDSNAEPVYKVGRRHQQQIIETQLAAPKTETRGAEVFARSNLAVSAADAIALEGRHSQRKAGSESLMPLAYQSRASVFEVDEEDPDFAAAEEGICGAVLNYVLGKQFVEDRGSLDENSVFLMPWQARVPLAIVACLRLTCCPQTLKKLVICTPFLGISVWSLFVVFDTLGRVNCASNHEYIFVSIGLVLCWMVIIPIILFSRNDYDSAGQGDDAAIERMEQKDSPSGLPDMRLECGPKIRLIFLTIASLARLATAGAFLALFLTFSSAQNCYHFLKIK